VAGSLALEEDARPRRAGCFPAVSRDLDSVLPEGDSEIATLARSARRRPLNIAPAASGAAPRFLSGCRWRFFRRKRWPPFSANRCRRDTPELAEYLRTVKMAAEIATYVLIIEG